MFPISGDSKAGRWLGWASRNRSWLLMAAGLVALVSWLTAGRHLAHMDRAMLESVLNRVRPAAAAHIVIVAIDDRSLEAIGRWPWRRALHAELIHQISRAAPRCIGLNLLLDETGAQHSGDDAFLASRMREAGCVVLPVAMQSAGRNGLLQSEVLPSQQLAAAATSLGHSHLAVDDDGNVQGVHLQEGFPGREWPQFSLALHEAANGWRLPRAPSPELEPATSPPEGRWQREHLEMLLYTSRAAPFQTVSYIDVLRGDVPAEFFRGRYVLVGATADGLADLFPVPAPSREGPMPGVEILANVLQALDRDQHIHQASTWQDLAFNLIPLVLALLGLLWLGPAGVFSLIVAMLVLRVGVQMAEPWTGVRFSRAAGLSGLLLVYPLWSLMRLTAAYRFLRRGTRELNTVLDGMATPNNTAPGSRGDFLDREIDATTTAVQRVRDMHRFMRDGVDHLPDASLVLDRHGRVFLANRSAARRWRRDAWALAGQDAHALLADLRSRLTGQPAIQPGALGPADPVPVSCEAEDGDGRILLLRCVPFFDADNAFAGWMATLVDISEMRHAQGQRDEALRFISHDIREPSASILTVLELARANAALMPGDLLLQRLERHARRGLELADGFVDLARAEAQPFRAEPLDLVALLVQAVDNGWAQAQRKEVRVEVEGDRGEALLLGDRELLSRALTNVLGNAVKFSPAGGAVTCRVEDEGAHWAVAIRDQGPGIAAEKQAQLFQPFHRLHRESHPEVQGIGLGLLLVRTTVQRHGGTVRIESAHGRGCTVILVLPKPSAGAWRPSAGDSLAQNEEP